MTESIQELLAREAEEAEERADAEERGEVAPSPGQRGRRQAADPSQVYAVRIPASRLRELRELADRLDIPPTTLIRQWVLEQLDRRREPSVPVAPVPLEAGSLKPGEIRLGPRRHRDRPDQDAVPREKQRA